MRVLTTRKEVDGMNFPGNRTSHLSLLAIIGTCVIISFVIAGSDGNEQGVVVSEDGLYYNLDTEKKTAVVSGYVNDITVAKIKLSINYNGESYSVNGILDDALFNSNGSSFSAYDGQLCAELRISDSAENGGSPRYIDALGNTYASVNDVLGRGNVAYNIWYLEKFGSCNLAVVCTKAIFTDNDGNEINHYVIFGDSYYNSKIKPANVSMTDIPKASNAYIASFLGTFTDAKGSFNFGNVNKMAIAGQYEIGSYTLRGSSSKVDAYRGYSSCSYGAIKTINAPNLEVLWINAGIVKGTQTETEVEIFEKCGKLNTVYLGKDAAFTSKIDGYAIRPGLEYRTSGYNSTNAIKVSDAVNIYPTDFFNKKKCSIRQIYVDPNNPYYESDDHYNVVKKGEDSTVIWESTAYDVTGTEEKDGSRIIVCIDIEQNFDFVEDPHLMITTSYDIPGYDGAFNNNLFIPIESVMAADGSRNKEESGHMLTFSFTSASYAGIFVAVVDGIPAEGEVIDYFGCWQTNEEQP